MQKCRFTSFSSRYSRSLLWLLLSCFSAFSFGQENLIQTLSLNYEKDSLKLVFNDLSEKTGWYFTYDANRVPGDSLISYTAENQRLYKIIADLIKGLELRFTTIDNHIVLYHGDEIPRILNPEEHSGVLEISGQVLDGSGRRPLAYASVAVFGKPKGTITNQKGEFRLSIPAPYTTDQLVVSYLGYRSQMLSIDSLAQLAWVSVSLEQEFVSIQEIIIRQADPLDLIKKAMARIPENYGKNPNRLTAFYREGVQRRSEFQIFSEAILDIYKSSYTRSWQTDQVKVIRSRKLVNADSRDTVLLKLQAGLNSSLTLDGMKNVFHFLDAENFYLYEYRLIDIQRFNDQEVYVVEFKQKPQVTEPLYTGRIYINPEDYAISHMEFAITPEYISKASDRFVVSQSRKYTIKPRQAGYQVSYRKYQEKYYLNHVRGDLQFSVRKRKKWFANPYSIFFELAVNTIDTLNVKRFPYRETISPRTVFTDEVFEYDQEFWGSNNYILPEEKLENALSRIQSSMEKYDKNR